MTFSLTVTSQVADWSPALAVMVAVPSAIAVMVPLLTVTIEASDVLHVTVLSVALLGETVAVSVSVSPTYNDVLVLFSEMEVTLTTFLFTVTVHVADLTPAFAVMVAVPSLIPFMVPLLTVAIDALDEVQVTLLSVASSGLTVAVIVWLSPSVRVIEVALRVMDETSMVLASTVTLHVADLSPALAVIVAVPSLIPVMVPLLTLAIEASEDVQVTLLSVALSGLTVAVMVVLAPTLMVNELLLNVIDVTATSFLSSPVPELLALTVTLQVAVLVPTMAVMVQVPGVLAVTTPSFTVAIDAFELDHVMVLLLALEGEMLAVSF